MKRVRRSTAGSVFPAVTTSLLLGLLTPWAVWEVLPVSLREPSRAYFWPLWPYLFALLAGLLAGRRGREGGLRLGLWAGLATGIPLLWLSHPTGIGATRWAIEIGLGVGLGMVGGVWGVNL